MEIAEIKTRMRDKGVRQVDLANATGLSPQKISLSLSGARQFKYAEMVVIERMLADVAPEIEQATARGIPMIGDVPGGNWREAVQRPQGWMPSPDPSMPANAFGLTVRGDSMDQYVDDGGTVIVNPDDKALYPGRFYVILNGDGETTFKQFQADPARLVPCSSNPAHRELVIGGEEGFQIVGRVIWRASRM